MVPLKTLKKITPARINTSPEIFSTGNSLCSFLINASCFSEKLVIVLEFVPELFLELLLEPLEWGFEFVVSMLKDC